MFPMPCLKLVRSRVHAFGAGDLLASFPLECSSGGPVRWHGVFVAGGGLGMPWRPAHLSGERAAGEKRGRLLPQDRPGHQALRRSDLRGTAQLAGARVSKQISSTPPCCVCAIACLIPMVKRNGCRCC